MAFLSSESLYRQPACESPFIFNIFPRENAGDKTKPIPPERLPSWVPPLFYFIMKDSCSVLAWYLKKNGNIKKKVSGESYNLFEFFGAERIKSAKTFGGSCQMLSVVKIGPTFQSRFFSFNLLFTVQPLHTHTHTHSRMI